MYDMYPWDKTAARPAARRAEDASGSAAGPDLKSVQAVQVALDRRDNGGDGAGAPAPTRQ